MAIKKWFGRTAQQPSGSSRASSWRYQVDITAGTELTAVCRRSGRVVTLNLELTSVPASNAWPAIGSIPPGVAPDHNVGCCPNGSSTNWLKVDSAGSITVYSPSSTTLPAIRASLSWILP